MKLIKEELENKFKGNPVRPIKNAKVDRPWTRRDLGMLPVSDKDSIIHRLSHGKAPGMDLILDNYLREDPDALEKAY